MNIIKKLFLSQPTTHNTQHTTNSGQSIIEVLIALTLIIMFLSGIVILQLFSVRNINYSENKSTAAKLARQQLDRVRVIRDSVGFDSLLSCTTSPGCFINVSLTPVQVTPTGVFDQIVTMQSASPSDCPIPSSVTPVPTSYLVNIKVILKGNSGSLTPTPIAQLSSCLTDWR